MKLDVDLIHVYQELAKSESPALKEIAKMMADYGVMELSEYVTLDHVKAVFVGMLSTRNQQLKMEDISTEAVVEFRTYALSLPSRP
mgnify:CR=1 FL=1